MNLTHYILCVHVCACVVVQITHISGRLREEVRVSSSQVDTKKRRKEAIVTFLNELKEKAAVRHHRSD